MAASFSMTGTVRLTPTWTEPLDLVDVVDSTPIVQAVSLANGTGSGQANCYWRDTRTVAASGTDTLDLTSLPLNVYGGTSTLNLSSLKLVYVRNKSATSNLLYYLNSQDSSFVITAGGLFLWTSPVVAPVGDPPANLITISGIEIVIDNLGTSAADYEIVLAGVKS